MCKFDIIETDEDTLGKVLYDIDQAIIPLTINQTSGGLKTLVDELAKAIDKLKITSDNKENYRNTYLNHILSQYYQMIGHRKCVRLDDQTLMDLNLTIKQYTCLITSFEMATCPIR